VKLNESNYQEQLLDIKNVAMVAFIAPWCGHCQKLLPEWEEAAHRLEGEDVTLGVVDATVENELATIYAVQGYPTIKVFPGGKKTHSDAMDYNGERTASAIVKFALEEVDRSVPREIPELTNHTMLTENCAGPNRICAIAALPHILDSGVEGRNKYRDVLAVISKRFRGGSFRFLWMEGGSQYDFEQVLELTFGYPAMVALSLDREAYTVMHGSFSEKAIGTFLAGITSGRQSTIKLSRELPTLITVEPWDGQEAKPPEDEIPLSEIMGWDDEDEEKEL
jgi:protein disulfide-isomerase A6